MSSKSDALQRPSLYSIVLHLAVLGQAVVLLALVQKNHQLRELVPSPPQALAVGSVPPVAPVLDLEGREASLTWDALDRDRLLVVFTTTCPVCKDSISSWRQLANTLGERTEILGISLDDVEATRRYQDQHDLPFEIVVARETKTLARQLEIPGVPTLIHVDRDGIVQGSWIGGLAEESLAEVVARVGNHRQASFGHSNAAFPMVSPPNRR